MLCEDGGVEIYSNLYGRGGQHSTWDENSLLCFAHAQNTRAKAFFMGLLSTWQPFVSLMCNRSSRAAGHPFGRSAQRGS